MRKDIYKTDDNNEKDRGIEKKNQEPGKHTELFAKWFRGNSLRMYTYCKDEKRQMRKEFHRKLQNSLKIINEIIF